MTRLWSRLGLFARLAVVCNAALAALGVLLIVGFVRLESTRVASDQAQRANIDTRMLAAALANPIAAGDSGAVSALLREFAQRPGVGRVAWTDPRGHAIAVEGAAGVRVAPAWFEAVTDLPAQAAQVAIVVGGVDHGQVQLEASPAAALDDAWSVVASGGRLMLVALGALMIVLLFTVSHGLRPLEGLAAAVHRFGRGDFGARAIPAGSPEIVASIHAFNAMAERITAVFAALHASESKNRRLAMIVEQSSESITTCDLAGTVTSWNPGAQRLFGWTSQEAIGKPLRELQFRGIDDAAHERLLAGLRSPRSIAAEGERVDKSGATLHVAATRAPLLDERGRVIGAIGVARDISALKRAQQALVRANEELEARVSMRTAELRAQEDLLRAVMDAMPGVVTFQDSQRRFQWFNRKLELWLGLPASAIRGRMPSELMRPENACLSRPYMDQAMAGQAVNFEWSYTHADGSVDELDTTFVPVCVDEAGISGVAAYSMDITQRKRADAALRESQARNRMLATMVERSNDSIHVRDLEGVITFWNQGAERLTGFSSAEALGQPLCSLHLADQSHAEIEAVLRRVRSGVATDLEARRQTKSGQLIEVAIRTEPLFDDAGQLCGEVAVLRDITSTKRAERDLRDAKDAAEAANRAKSEFLANMSHEIRTPLNGLLGIADLVLDTQLTREQRDDLELVKVSGTSLLTLINDILDFSKIEAGHLDLEAIEFAPADNIADTLRIFAPRAAAKGVALVYQPQGLPELVRGDPGRLRQIVTNLVGNAIKFTAQGEVCVGATVEPAADGQMLLKVSVRDTGIGIAADKHGSIFDPFSQADASTTRRYGGTGLGLTISARLARLMGGAIEVDSVPGQGSCFRFWVRCGSVESAAPADASNRGRILEGHAVLLIEDNHRYRASLARLLAGWGMPVTEAPHGEAGLEMLRRGHAAASPAPLVLLDALLPGIDGFAVARELQMQAGLARSVVVLTGAAQRGDAARWRELGVAALLTKPVRPTELFETLAAISVADSAAPSMLITRHSLREARRGEPILVAEDNPINQMLVRRVLEKLGHTVRIVGSGQEALDALLGEAFSLVLMDMQMPGMGGLEAAAAIRLREAGSPTRLPIVALTANALPSDRHACLAAGMDDYLSKPFSAEQLASVLERWLPEGATNSGAAPAPRGVIEAAAPDTATHLDIDVLKGYIGDDDEAVVEFLNSYLASSTQARERLVRHHREHDAGAIEDVAHQLKSTARTVGAMALGTCCAGLESSAAGADWAALDAALPGLVALLDRSAEQALAWLAAHAHDEAGARS